MRNYATGITASGEHLRFERWAYEAYREGRMTDAWLEAQFARCVRFVVEW